LLKKTYRAKVGGVEGNGPFSPERSHFPSNAVIKTHGITQGEKLSGKKAAISWEGRQCRPKRVTPSGNQSGSNPESIEVRTKNNLRLIRSKEGDRGAFFAASEEKMIACRRGRGPLPKGRGKRRAE